MVARLLGLVLRHEFAMFGLAVKLAAFSMVNLAGRINPDHPFGLCVGNLLIRGRRGLFSSLGAR